MRKTVGLILVILTAVGVFCVVTVKAQFTQNITIDVNGQITPSDAPIQRLGNIYTLTADLTAP